MYECESAAWLDIVQPIRRLGRHNKCLHQSRWALGGACKLEAVYRFGGNTMKVWTKPAVREQEVGLEVTSYLPAEIDLI
jgi:coenzyme PQQ precursor peptide PqqA